MTGLVQAPVVAPSPPPAAPSPPPAVPPRRWDRGGSRLAAAALLVGTALLYLVGLSRSGWANQFYAAAVQAGSKSWKAFLFGSLDWSNGITVDKPPASLWVMELSARVFGVNSWSILVPQALEGVASVALLYATVTRVAGRGAGLLAGLVLAVTPVATLMFRFDNPDALLVLLMTAGAYATTRACERGGTRWLVLAGALIGTAFLTKMLQAFLVLPGFTAAYLATAPTSWRRRLRDVVLAGGAVVVGAGWWVALVELWPAGARPYVGGTTTNSVLELVFGYNGLGRLDGGSNNGAVGGGTGGFSTGQTGLGRLFGSEMGGQISWLLPAALLALGALVWLTWRGPATRMMRAATIVWGGWLLVTAVVFSYAQGIIHAYYTVALAPAIGALVGLGVAVLWRERTHPGALWTLATVVGSGAVWSSVLLGRADVASWLRWVVLLAGAVSVVALLVGAPAGRRGLVGLALVTGLVGGVAGPTAWSLQTASTAHTGALPTAGPATTAGFGGGRGAGPGGGARAFPGGTGAPPAGTGGPGTGGTGTPAAGGRPGGGFGGAGGLSGATTVSAALSDALAADAAGYTWAAAVTGDNEAASLQLAADVPVLSLGGYNGTDPAVTLAQFRADVAAGDIHYYVVSNGFIGSTSSTTSTAYAIEQWVEATYSATTVGGTTVYDLSAGPTS